MPIGTEFTRSLEKNFQVRNTGFALLVSTHTMMIGISMPISGVRIVRTSFTNTLFVFFFATGGFAPLLIAAFCIL